MTSPSTEASRPEGWSTTTVNEVAETIEYGYTASASTAPVGPKFLRITDIQNGHVGWDRVPFCEIAKEKLARFRLTSGDIVFARTGATTGKSFLIRDCPDDVIFASYLIRVRPGAGVAPAFLSLFFQTPEYWELISENVAGNAQPNCNASKLAALSLPLPPLAEQERIVAKLEAVLFRVNAARERLAKVSAILRRFRQAVLAAACSGRLTADWRAAPKVSPVGSRIAQLLHDRKRIFESAQPVGGDRNPNGRRARYKVPHDAVAPDGEVLPDTWAWVSVSQLCFQDVGFAFKSAEFTTQGVRLLRGENVEPGKLRWSDVRWWPPEKLGEFRSLMVEEGDLILAMDRPVISTGLKLARARRDDLPCLLVQRVMRFRMVERETADYLHLCLMHPAFTGFLSHDGMTGSDLPHITGTGVAEYPIPLPPIEEQREIVTRAAKLFALADKIEARLASATARADLLTQAILAKAFRGELVETEAELAAKEGREFETAEQLLARIRAARESVPDRSPTRPRPRRRRQRTTAP